MPIRWSACAGLLLIVALGACGSDSGNSSASGTHLEVEGVVTIGSASVAPNPDDPQEPMPDPGDATEVEISGNLECDGPQSIGTGLFEGTAVNVCLTLEGQQAVFEDISANDDSVACAEIYGGPQRATITGAIAGVPVDVTVDRTNSCGIQDWQRLEFLLGPPER